MAMLPRYVLTSTPRLPSQLGYQHCLQGNHRASLNLVQWCHASQQASSVLPGCNFMNSASFARAHETSLVNHWSPSCVDQQPSPLFAVGYPSFSRLIVSYERNVYDGGYPNSVNMNLESEKSKKRPHVSSCHEALSKSKVMKTQRMGSARHAPPEGRRSRVGSEGSWRQGFMQEDWPKTAMDCQWRREMHNFQPDQSGGTGVPYSNQSLSSSRKNYTNSAASAPPYHTQQQIHVQKPSSPAQLTGSSCGQSPPGCHGFHSFVTSNQASLPPSDSKTAHTKRLWFDVQRERGPPRGQQSSRKRSFEFSVQSYNVLAQCLIKENRRLYQHCDQGILPWEYRRQNLLREIKDTEADVICMQEVESDHFRYFFEPELDKLGYGSIYKKRTGNKGDGCATFYKTNRFTHVYHTKLEYQRRIGCLDRDNVAIVVLLQPKGLPSSQRVCIANTHLLWNPRRGDVKLAQLGLLFAEIERMAHVSNAPTRNTYHPVVLCGDFNSVPHCPLYKFVKKGIVNYEGMKMTDVSGQAEGGSTQTMSSPLWPHQVGVTQRCCYAYRDVSASKPHAADSHHNTGRNPAQSIAGAFQANNNASSLHEPDPSSNHSQGDLIHHLCFSSVYDHSAGNREVTTNHSRTNCTVDYIFYTGWPQRRRRSSNNPANVVERPVFTSNLSLVRRLSLFTDSEIKSMGGLPNAQWSSDHLSLLGLLRLTPHK